MMRGLASATGDPDGSLRRVSGLFVVAILLAGGAGLLLAAFTAGPPRPPEPVADSAWFDPYADRYRDAGRVAPLPRSVPVRIEIPRIDVDAKLISLGVDSRGEVEVPPLRQADKAGWYRYGVTPGEAGSAVVIGHVDSRELGPAVFFNLAKLDRGDTISVRREDRSVATFEVDGVESYPKATFPADLVYGPSPRSSLRVVTCGGKYDERARGYLENVIVFATLTST